MDKNKISRISMYYGYIRVGKDTDINVEQAYRTELQEFGVKVENMHIERGDYWDDLPIFQDLITNILDSNDILYIPRLKQVGKSLMDFLKLQQKLRYKNILLILLELPNPTDLTFQDQLQEALSELGQKEFEQRIRRQKRGIQKAKQKGLFGPKTKMTAKTVALIYKLKKEKKPVREIAEIVSYSQATIYRVMSKEFKYPLPSKNEVENE